MTDRIDTAALRRAREETTRGEWRWQADSFAGLYADREWLLHYTIDDDGIHCANPADGDFIALAHREWPALLDRIDALEATLRKAWELMAETVNDFAGPYHEGPEGEQELVPIHPRLSDMNAFLNANMEFAAALGDPS